MQEEGEEDTMVDVMAEEEVVGVTAADVLWSITLATGETHGLFMASNKQMVD